METGPQLKVSSNRLVKPGIEPGTPGLQGKRFIRYTTAAPKDTTWESNKTTINIKNKSQEVSPFPAGDHKAAMNRRKSMTIIRHK